MTSAKPRGYYTVALLVAFVLSSTLAVECMKNENIGRQGTNVYRCDDANKPRCCEDGHPREFTCCEADSTRTRREQIILGASFSALFVLLLVICVCLVKDIACCKRRTLRDSVDSTCCCRRFLRLLITARNVIVHDASLLGRTKGAKSDGDTGEFYRLDSSRGNNRDVMPVPQNIRSYQHEIHPARPIQLSSQYDRRLQLTTHL